jgi:hypothetical protein
VRASVELSRLSRDNPSLPRGSARARRPGGAAEEGRSGRRHGQRRRGPTTASRAGNDGAATASTARRGHDNPFNPRRTYSGGRYQSGGGSSR